MTDKYQRAIASATVKYLEQDFLKNQIQTFRHDRNGMPLSESVDQYQAYFNQLYESLTDEARD
jgi:hypothetical protein